MKRVIAATLMVAAGSACATDVYTNKGDFLAVLNAGFYLEDFTSVPTGAVAELDFGPVNGFSYKVTSDGASGPINGLFNAPGILSINVAQDVMVITFNGADVTAVGGDFWATDINFATIPAKVTLTLSDGTVHAYDATSPTDFRGFTSTVPITSIEIDAEDVPVVAWPTVDNLYVGTSGAGGGCYPDCDLDTNLTIDDFICFQTTFALGDPYADCDGDTLLTIDDFICFQTSFAIGC